jgi:hypothetical protein
MVDNDRGVNRIGKRILERLFSNPADMDETRLPWRYSSIHFLIRDSAWDAVRYAARLLFRPTVKEWMYFPVDRRFSFIHYVLRPLRLIVVYAAGSRDT